MKSLTTSELKCFLYAQVACLLLALFLIFANNRTTIHFSGVMYYLYLTSGICLMGGLVLQSFIRQNSRAILLKLAGLYGAISVMMFSLLYIC